MEADALKNEIEDLVADMIQNDTREDKKSSNNGSEGKRKS